MDVGTDSAQIHFISAKEFELHYDYFFSILRNHITRMEFDELAYFKQGERSLFPGTLLYYENYGSDGGVYCLEFWPSDTIRAKYIVSCFTILSSHFKIEGAKLLYHPKGVGQEKIAFENEVLFTENGIESITTDKLCNNLDFIPFNNGESYGVLKSSQDNNFAVSDIVLLKTIPNNLSHVSGIITALPQTPLSHVNLIAKQNGIPNAYIKDPFDNETIASLIGKYVHFVVSDNEYIIEEATEAEVQTYLEKFRPKSAQTPIIDTTSLLIRALENIEFSDNNIFGTKASNVAELGRILPDGASPKGFAVSFGFYYDFMKSNGFFDSAQVMMSDAKFINDLVYREQRLKTFRDMIKSGYVGDTTIQRFETEIRNKFEIGRSLRCRSSTNGEDLEGFVGAGLYNSYTHKVTEGVLANSIKQVWSSIWTYRAFQERSFYKIDHLKTASAVLIHENYSGELSNGVAVTKNIYNQYKGYYVNVQLGDDLVTNPNEESIPEEFVVSRIGQGGTYEVQYIRYSNVVNEGAKVLSSEHIRLLRYYLSLIDDRFRFLYNDYSEEFAMEVEFKITSEGDLVIKQARPWK